MATIDDFAKLDIRVGKIVSVEDLPGAKKPLWKLRIDFGQLGVKNSAAGIKEFYTKEQLMNRQVVAIVNFPPRQIAGFASECLVLAAVDKNNNVILLQPEKDAELGAKIA